MKQDSDSYLNKKAYFDQLLTVYGRNTVIEALSTPAITAVKLHLAESNKPAKILEEIVDLATKLGAEINYHSKEKLSRISKNAKQDQGVALDIKPNRFENFDQHLQSAPKQGEYLALDRITNPQNLGMIIRSVCAAGLAGLILPQKGCAKLDPLVIKASAGTLFKAPILRCNSLAQALNKAKSSGFEIVGLDLRARSKISEIPKNVKTIFVLGNESEGISQEIRSACTQTALIPMQNDVESLNVAVTASLIAFRYSL